MSSTVALTRLDTHHWERPIAPSIQEVELKNMPWWWRDDGRSMELVACTRSMSSVVTSIGGGLSDVVNEGACMHETAFTHGQVPFTPITLRG